MRFLNPWLMDLVGGVWVVMGTLLALMPIAGRSCYSTGAADGCFTIAQALNPSVTLREGHD